MAEYGEWNLKGATLSDATAQKDYGVSRDFIVKGIREGKLEYREGAILGESLSENLEEPTREIHRRSARRRPTGGCQEPHRTAKGEK